jgi:hypothetical protein
MITQASYKFLIIVFSLLFSISGIAQKQSYNWLFANSCALDFNSGSPVPFDAFGSISTHEGSASISNEDGELLFYSDGSTVWNKDQLVMPNGTGLGGGISSTQSALIIKKPDNENIYYLFTIAQEGGPYGMRYNEVDMTLDGGLGDINAVKNIVIEEETTEKLAAVLHQNGKDIWVVTQKAGSNVFHSYLVTSDGITLTPVISTIGEVLSNSTTAGVGYLKASPNGLKMASAKYLDEGLDLFDFDNATGILSNVQSLTVSYPYGVEFSSNNSVLYVTTHYGDEMGIHQFDISVCGEDNIQDTRTFLGASTIGSQALVLGKDDKIYAATHIHSFLDVIEYPNNLGLACNFLDNEIDLMAGGGSGLSIIGLPNFQNSWNYKHHYFTICENDTVALTDYKNSLHNWVLETDDAVILSTDSIYFVSPETTTTYIEFDDEDTVLYTVNVIDAPGMMGIFLGNDTTLCPDETLLLIETGSENDFLWQDGSTDTSFTVTEAGTYWLKVTNDNCCSSSDTIEVDYTVIDLTIDVDEFTLTANAIADAYQWIDCNKDYDIIPGETDQSYTAPTIGSYAVILTIDGCIDTTECIELTDFQSIPENKDEVLRYFPNPTTGDVTLVLNDFTQIENIRIITPEGKILQHYSANAEQVDIQLSAARGLYFIQLIDNNNTVFTYKIVKE